MLFVPYYLEGLAHASYLVGCGGEAAVVDPQRDVDVYVEEAARHGIAIGRVIVTHVHSDFVTGHRELGERTGARIYLGPGSGAGFAHEVARDGDELALGGARLCFVATPGHTPESLSLLVYEPGAARPSRLLSGDTLGERALPDLTAAPDADAAQLASALHDSIARLLALDGDLEVWPAHGAAAAAGGGVGAALGSTIGRLRREHPALPREAFVARVTAGLPRAPAYFARIAALNRQGAPALAGAPRPPSLRAAEVARLVDEAALVVDTRSMEDFARGHIPGALFIGLRGSFSPWAGLLLPADRPLVLVADDARAVDEAVVRLARVGLERVAGWLGGGMFSWRRELRPTPSLDVVTVARMARQRDVSAVVDVRPRAEFAAGHVPGARSLPLDELEPRLGELDARASLAVVCGTGYRSTIAASVLVRRGFARVRNLAGGMRAWMAAALPVSRDAGAT